MAKGKSTTKRARTPQWLRSIGRGLKKALVIFIFLRPFGRYIKGAWQELRQVKWPSRKASIQLTFAVVLFTVVMTAFIVLLDTGFEALVKRIIL